MLISPTINKTPTFKKVEIINNGRNITSDNENTIYIASTKVVVLCQKRKIPRSQQTIHKQKRKCSNKTTNTFNAIKKTWQLIKPGDGGTIYTYNNHIVMNMFLYIYLCVIFKKFLEVSKCEWFLVKKICKITNVVRGRPTFLFRLLCCVRLILRCL